jgi:hypothetical protein
MRSIPGFLSQCALALSCGLSLQAGDFAGGSGTGSDPWLVETAVQLQAVGDHLNAHFRQVADIDLENVIFTPIAFTDFNDDVIQFRGVFDGDGHLIRNLRIRDPQSDVIALFSKLGPEGIIRDVHVRDVDLEGRLCSAGLVAENNGLIERCSSTGKVVGSSWAGGLVGDNRTTVLDSYSHAEVSAGSSPGGLVGVHYGSAPPRLERCYASGSITGSAGGGLVGSIIAASPVVVDSYWDVQSTGESTSAGGVGLSSVEMRTRSIFEPAWDFAMTWKIVEGVRPPEHQSTAGIPGDVDSDGSVDGIDLSIVLGYWGDCPGGLPCDADLNGDLVVNGLDLTVVLGYWMTKGL